MRTSSPGRPDRRPPARTQDDPERYAPTLSADRRRVNDRDDPDVDLGEAGFAAGGRTRAARGAHALRATTETVASPTNIDVLIDRFMRHSIVAGTLVVAGGAFFGGGRGVSPPVARKEAPPKD